MESLLSALRHWANIDPTRPAITIQSADGNVITFCSYATLDQLSDSVAVALIDLTPPCSTIALQGLSEENTIYAFLGALKANRIPVIQSNIDKSSQLILDGLSWTPDYIVMNQNTNSHQINLSVKQPQILEIRDLLNRLEQVPNSTQNTQNTAYYQSTSSPKHTHRLIPIKHGEVARWLSYTGMVHATHSFEGKSFFWAPLSHTIGLYYGLLMPIYHGGESVRLSLPDVLTTNSGIISGFSQSKPIITGGPISILMQSFNHLMRCADDKLHKIIDLSNLQKILLCGETAHASDLDKLDILLRSLNFKGSI